MNMRHLMRVALLCLCCATAQAQPGTVTAAPDEVQTGLDAMHQQLRLAFALRPSLPLDADLRSAVQAMVDRELPRMRQVLTAWFEQERQLRPLESTTATFQAVRGRMFNEMALWQLDSEGPAHDRRQQQAMAHPRSCDIPEGPGSFLDDLALAWQHVALADRPAYLASEAVLLSRWGAARAPAAPRPVPSADELAWQAVDRLVKAKDPAQPALPPVLAWRLLSRSSDDQVREYPANVCVLRQWTLRNALAQQRLTAEQWLALRYQMGPTADRWWGADRNGEDPTGYPALARFLWVQGAITVAVTVDARGKFVSAAVVERDVRVPGIRDQQPLAFDTLFDRASLQRAATMKHAAPAAEALSQGRATRRVVFDFKLD